MEPPDAPTRPPVRRGSALDLLRNGPPPPPRPPGRPRGPQRPELKGGVGGGPKGHTRAGRVGQERMRLKIAMMDAAACSPTEIARGLLLSRDRVKTILSEVETTTLVKDFRDLVRSHALSESLNIAVKGMRWVNEAIDGRDAKEFDLVTRGLGNMEKVWSSASGENRPAPTQIAVINNQPGESTAAELAQLLELLAPPQATP